MKAANHKKRTGIRRSRVKRWRVIAREHGLDYRTVVRAERPGQAIAIAEIYFREGARLADFAIVSCAPAPAPMRSNTNVTLLRGGARA